MLDTVTHFQKYFTDKSVKWTTKSFNVIIIITVLLLANNTFDFLGSYRLNNKLDQLTKISFLLKDSLTTNNEKSFLYYHKNQIIEDLNYIEKGQKIFGHLFNNFSFTNIKHSLESLTEVNPKTVKRNFYLHYFFSNTFIIFIMLVIPYSLVKHSNIKSVKLAIATTIIMWIGLILIGLVFAFILGLVPTLKYLWINYLLDFILSWTMIFIILKIPKVKATLKI